MNFDKTTSCKNDDLTTELEFNERAVANVMYGAYGATSGLTLDCLRAYNTTLEMDTFSEFDSDIIYACECKQCDSFILPKVRCYTSHRRINGE